jgi:protein O-GlcNAc transferase
MAPANFVGELLSLHAAGRIADMEARARVHLKAQPSSPILNELLGIALTAQRRFAEALPFLEKAVRRQPDEPQFCENLALCLRELRQYAAAERNLRLALNLRPRSIEALNALGSVLRELDCPAEAETAFRGALAIDPDYPAANYNLGKALLAPNTAVEANTYLQRALARAPNLLPAVHHSLGRYFARIGEPAAAEDHFRKALASAPNDAATLVALASLLGDCGRGNEARQICGQLLALVGDVRQAARSGYDFVLSGLANLLVVHSRPAEATAIFRALWEIRADPDIALPAYEAARNACDWDFAKTVEAKALAATRLAKWTAEGLSSFTVLSMPSAKRRDQLAAAKLHAGLFADDVTALERRPPAPQDASRRLRIGYLSSDFHNHATAHLLAGVIEAHDRDAFEIVAYDHSPQVDDGYRQRLKQSFERFVPVHAMANAAVAQLIADDGIDIAIDLKGWTQNNRSSILAARPAAIQMQWLGFPGTMGAPWIDYIVADPVVIRAGEEGDYSEKIIRLPHSYQPNDRNRPIAAVPTREEAGLPAAGIVFCSFNQAFKLTSDLFSVWTDLLARVENSVLWLLEFPVPVMEALRRRAGAAGIAPERIVFAPHRPIAEHLARTSLADVALDCCPYGAHTTASDALWAGVPFVALAGDTFASRVSSSLVTALGMPELITSSPRAYAELAYRLATDIPMRVATRSRVTALRDTAPLFDTLRFTRHLEAALRMAWQRRMAGLAPDHLQVRDEDV